ERYHRRASSLRAETRKSLGIVTLEERGDRQQLCRCHHTLAPSAVNTHLEHQPVLPLMIHRSAACLSADPTRRQCRKSPQLQPPGPCAPETAFEPIPSRGDAVPLTRR